MISSLAPGSLMNFRDLGGAPTRDGVVARGRLFRTAHLSDLDHESAAHLHGVLGIRAYLDFRAEPEITRDGAPQRLLERGVRWQRHPFDISDTAFQALRVPQPGDWQALYERALGRLRPELAGAIRAIAEHEDPIVFGCWAGKDRTGMVSGLLLSLLGVDDAWIAEEYAKTTQSLLPHKHRFSFLWKDEPAREPELLRAHLHTDPRTMIGLLRAARERFGTVNDALDLPDAVIARLRARYLVG